MLHCFLFGISNDRIDSLKLFYQTATDDEMEFDLLIELANAYVNSNSDSTAFYLNKAEILLGTIVDKTRLADFHFSKGLYLRSVYSNDSAIVSTRKALNLYRQLEHDDEVIKSNILIANSYYDLVSYDSAYKYYAIGLSHTDSIADPWNYAAYLNNIANVYYVQNKRGDALKFYLRAKEIFIGLEANREIAITKNNIGQIYHELGNYQMAIKFTVEAIAINLEINNLDQLLSDYNSISQVYRDMEMYDSAIYYISEAIQISKESKFEFSLAQSYHTLGSVYMSIEDYNNAETYFLVSLEISERLDIPIGQVVNMISLGEVYTEYKDFQKAEDMLTEALNLSKKLELSDHLSMALMRFNQLYKAWGIFDKALSYHEEYTHLKDSIEELHNLNKLSEIQARYESEQKELENQRLKNKNKEQEYTIFKQQVLVLISIAFTIVAALLIAMMFSIRKRRKDRIAVLQAKNKKIEEQSEELAISNSTKDKLFSIISHDLRSPFSSLMGFVTLLEQEAENGNFDNALYYIKQLNTATVNTYELIDNLLNWSRTQQDNIVIQITPVSLYKLTDGIISSMEALIDEKGINIYNEIPENLKAKSDSHILSVIIRNLLSNAVKFTERGGNIYLSTEVTEKGIIISIKDNGTGFTNEMKEKLLDKEGGFSTPGTENEQGSGLGMMLVNEFIEKLNGELMIESKPGLGSTFSFCIPN